MIVREQAAVQRIRQLHRCRLACSLFETRPNLFRSILPPGFLRSAKRKPIAGTSPER